MGVLVSSNEIPLPESPRPMAAHGKKQGINNCTESDTLLLLYSPCVNLPVEVIGVANHVAH